MGPVSWDFCSSLYAPASLALAFAWASHERGVPWACLAASTALACCLMSFRAIRRRDELGYNAWHIVATAVICAV